MAGSKGSGAKVAVWGIVGLLIIGLGGFGTANFGGTVRSVGSVGDEDIDINAYAQALRTEINAISQQTGQQISVAQAEQLGLSGQVLDGLLTRAALDGEMTNLGISIGDDELRRNLASISAFQGLDGNFDVDTYKFALERTGQSTTEFEAELRKDSARAILQGALATGVVMPNNYAQVIVDWLGERRTIEVATLTAADVETSIGTPDDAQITAQYEATPDAYTAPETRDVTYAWLSPEMLVDTVELDDAVLRELYDENIAQFIQPERRLVERLIFSDTTAAQEASDRIVAGESTFEDEVAARGLTLVDIDLGDVSARDLGTASDAVFALAESGVTTPTQTDLGPALFRVNGILTANEITFEQARDDLAKEMAADAARRDIAAQLEQLDDLLASGATLEELASETDMTLGQLAWTTQSEDGIASYQTFVSAVQAAQIGDFPEIIELSDGGVFALRLNAIIAPELRPLDAIKDQVIADWQTAETARLLKARAEEIQTDVASGTDITTLGLATERFVEITRRDYISTMPASFIDTVFAPGLDADATVIIEGDGRVVIAKITAVLAPENNPEMDQIADTYAQQAGQGAAQDVIAAFAEALRDRDGISINQAALNAVHSQLQ